MSTMTAADHSQQRQLSLLTPGQRPSLSPSVILRILSFSHPLTAFTSRLVSRDWNDAVNNGDSTFWRHIVSACLPWCQLTLQLLEQAAQRRYRELRHFSKMSLANVKSLQHVIVCDITNHPVLWFTDVACQTNIQLIYDAVAHSLAPFLDAHEVVLLGSGIVLDRFKKIDEMVWPTRSGRKGWRLDMWIVVRGFEYSCAPMKKTQVQKKNSVADASEDPSAASFVSFNSVVLQEVKEPQREYPVVDPVDFLEFLENQAAQKENLVPSDL